MNEDTSEIQGNDPIQTQEPEAVAEEPLPPLRKTWRIRLVWLLLVFAVIATDQFTKGLIMQFVEEGRNIAVVDDLFYITHVRNPGAAFGMFSDLPDGWRELVLTTLGGVALALVIFYSVRLNPREWLSQTALHLIFAGAIGNLADRFIHGSVTDFILFRHGHWSFPAFNVADSSIVIGVCLLLLDTLLPRHAAKKPVVDPAADALAAAADIELSGPRPVKPGAFDSIDSQQSEAEADAGEPTPHRS